MDYKNKNENTNTLDQPWLPFTDDSYNYIMFLHENVLIIIDVLKQEKSSNHNNTESNLYIQKLILPLQKLSNDFTELIKTNTNNRVVFYNLESQRYFRFLLSANVFFRIIITSSEDTPKLVNTKK